MSFENIHLGRIKFPRHPLGFIKRIFSGDSGSESILQFSIYSYEKQSTSDQRTIFSLPLEDLNFAWLEETLLNLESGQELALNSICQFKGRNVHIPMIDFGSKQIEYDYLNDVKKAMLDLNIKMEIFQSGRSFHGYGYPLITHAHWIKLMGHLLLLNRPSKARIVDSRWVGHRLVAGYSALRWSKNTNQYKQYPTYVGSLNAIKSLI